MSHQTLILHQSVPLNVQVPEKGNVVPLDKITKNLKDIIFTHIKLI